MPIKAINVSITEFMCLIWKSFKVDKQGGTGSSSAARRIFCKSAVGTLSCSHAILAASLAASSNSRICLWTLSTSALMFSGAHRSGVMVMVIVRVGIAVSVVAGTDSGVTTVLQQTYTSIVKMMAAEKMSSIDFFMY